jgi:ribonuclease VapC
LKIAVDTSAIIAVLLGEPEADEFRGMLLTNEPYVIGPILLETVMVLSRRIPTKPDEWLLAFLFSIGAETVPFDQQMTVLAQDAFLAFGKGRHPAKLNFGDCMAYALAKSQGMPLLFKGDDFALTDIARAI